MYSIIENIYIDVVLSTSMVGTILAMNLRNWCQQ